MNSQLAKKVLEKRKREGERKGVTIKQMDGNYSDQSKCSTVTIKRERERKRGSLAERHKSGYKMMRKQYTSKFLSHQE